ncbi:DNA-binding protein [Terrihabitans soli]|uniref:DNA-binding protein n=1 Tax=Terrihabitans soli TaxID=708113 RepID=A0A6S6QX97_9HYPH|nr:helix-turn-helix transcriptional regulator [Terrihabitans soli]BCJ91892.1 DNA-binding protein [Terrihabitans soli]
MLTHTRIWNAIDSLAEANGMSASGLAKKAGLDPTTFNRSKRIAADGRPRWPSTESVAKILHATGSSLESFLDIVGGRGRAGNRTVPLINFAQATRGTYFTEVGHPVGNGWDELTLPDIDDDHCYALEISGDTLLPLYRKGDTIVVSPSAKPRRGDRVVVRTSSGDMFVKELQRKTDKFVELRGFDPEQGDRTIPMADIAWIARILWASQ